jgi:predicted nucleic acid-binding protein
MIDATCLFDTSVYVAAIRGRNAAALERLPGEMAVRMSAVVLQELYAGTAASSRGVVEELENSFAQENNILVPDLSDWIGAGKMLASIAAKYGYEKIGRSRLTNDALIAASASRAGTRVLTTNGRDFARLAEFCNLRWQMVAL